MKKQDDEYICVDREHGLWKRKEPKENVNADRLALALALETIRELERENNELHAEIANLNSLLLEAKRCFSHEFMAELHSECNMLGRENAALREALQNCAISASGQNWQQIAWIVEGALHRRKEAQP